MGARRAQPPLARNIPRPGSAVQGLSQEFVPNHFDVKEIGRELDITCWSRSSSTQIIHQICPSDLISSSVSMFDGTFHMEEPSLMFGWEQPPLDSQQPTRITLGVDARLQVFLSIFLSTPLLKSGEISSKITSVMRPW
ncbi:hypothetical protein FGADI_10089 [Fusarium gaditjirri]|uniref:Uncharacterized protein n=1 Tax=Fusarium gaditjirri TaxID=282569 RepID=A0A8H4WS75_9HYPO|nr:hypothetical protein FGADI_10089 [Fusarium gaditjirri]